MPIVRERFLEKLNDSYSYYYDVVEGEAGSGLPLIFMAEFHARDEGYVLVKRARIWAAESNEYAYIFSVPVLDEETAEKCLDYTLEDAVPRIKPHREHKDSYIIAVFVADVISPEAEKAICLRTYEKSFKFGLEGWSTLKTAAVDLEKGVVRTNKAGANIQKTLKKLLRSERV